MGSSAGKTVSVPIKGHIDFNQSEEGLSSNEDSTRVICSRSKHEWQNNTLASRNHHHFRNRSQKMSLTCRGACVLRLGLTTDDPFQDEQFIQKSVFEIEDGFDNSTKTTKTISINDFDTLMYGLPEKQREFPLQLKGRHMWLYIIVIYGKPDITASFGDKDHEEAINLQLLTTRELLNNFIVDDLASSIRSNRQKHFLNSHTVKCRMREPLMMDKVYYIHWKMSLTEESVANSSPIHGLMRIRLLEKINNDAVENTESSVTEAVAWDCSSAVRNYPFSGIISMKVDSNENTVEHNLLLRSVSNTKIENLKLKEEMPHLILEVEYSSGELMISRNHTTVGQGYGSLIMVSDSSGSIDVMDLTMKIEGALQMLPMRVQYGTDPDKLLVEFSDILTPSNMDTLKKCLAPARMELEAETSVIQILGVPDTVHKFGLESYFTRSQVGGGEIVKLYRPSNIPRCWLVKFKNKTVAREVWMQTKHSIGGFVVHVLPYYRRLGFASVSVEGVYGGKPHFDTDDVVLDNMDPNKLALLERSKTFRKGFEAFLRQTVNVKVIWNQFQTTDGHIVCRCTEARTNYRKLAVWREVTMAEIEKYFASKFLSQEVKVVEEIWDECLEAIEKQTTAQTDILVIPDRGNCSFNIIGLNHQGIKTLCTRISHWKHETPSEIISEQIQVRMPNYRVLQEEKLIPTIECRYPNISFRVDSHLETVTIVGPRNELVGAKRALLQLALSAVKIEVKVLPSVERFLKSDTGTLYLQNVLRGNSVNPNFDIKPEKVVFLTCIQENKHTLRQREDDLKSLISRTICVEIVTMPNEVVDGFECQEWEDVKREQLAKKVIVTEISQSEVEIAGVHNIVSEARKSIQEYFTNAAVGKTSTKMSPSIAEYLDKYRNDIYASDCKFVRLEGRFYTGTVTIISEMNRLKTIKEKMMEDVKSVHTFCVMISRPWLASVIQEVNGFDRLAKKKQCTIRADIGDTLAANNVQSVAIYNKTGACIQIKFGNSWSETADAIVNSASPNLEFDTGISHEIVRKGGMSIQDECVQILRETGKVDIGTVLLGTPGRLHCMNIIHAVAPKWKDGNEREESLMKQTVRNILETTQTERFTSVIIPALRTDIDQYPKDLATKHIVETVAEFLENEPSTLKEVCLIGPSTEIVNLFSEAVNSLPSAPWSVFKHGRKLHGKLLSGKNQIGFQLQWGQNETAQRDEKWKEESTSSRFTNAEEGVKGELPYTLPMTESTTLHVAKGVHFSREAEAVVNITYANQLSDLGRALLKAAGSKVEKEFMTIKAGVNDDIRITDGGDLFCKKLVHISIPEMRDENEIVYNTVMKALTKVATFKFTSIAFPGIDTEIVGVSVDNVAHGMVKAVCDFIAREHGPTLQNVYICVDVDETSTIQAFGEVLKPYLAHRPGTMKLSRSGTTKYMPTEEHTVADDVVVFKVMTMANIEDIRRRLEKVVNKELITRKHSVKHLVEGLEEMSLKEKEEESLKTLEQNHGVTINVKKKKMVVKITGLRDRVGRAEFELVKLLQFDFPAARNREGFERHLAKSIQWFYEDVSDGSKNPFDSSSNFDIYVGFTSCNDFVYNNAAEGKQYKVSVRYQEEHPKHDPNRKRQIYQRMVNVGGMVSVEWEISQTGLEKAKVQLNVSDPEYQMVKQKFKKDGCANRVLQIYRLEHRFMWLLYEAKKCQIDKQNGRGSQNEQRLWHGTDPDTVNKIIKDGYNRSFCGKNATAYGNGAYFATQSSYSHKYAKVDQTGVRQMFLNRVLTGAFCKGAAGMNYLPVKNVVNNMPILYDSAANDLGAPSIFIIFHDSQAYPEYLIEYN